MKRSPILVFAGFVLATASALAQATLTLPDASPAATVSQTVGLTTLTIDYHRPAVNKRKVWGELVPYGDVWRAGANENTTLTASTPFTFGGKAVPAGTYGLHMLPTEKDWTVILSQQSTAWGSFSYDQKEDVVRVTVDAEAGGLRGAARVPLRRADGRRRRRSSCGGRSSPSRSRSRSTPRRSCSRASEGQLRGLPRFGWQGWNQAANWCLRNDVQARPGPGVGGPVDRDAVELHEPADQGRDPREEGRRSEGSRGPARPGHEGRDRGGRQHCSGTSFWARRRPPRRSRSSARTSRTTRSPGTPTTASARPSPRRATRRAPSRTTARPSP